MMMAVRVAGPDPPEPRSDERISRMPPCACVGRALGPPEAMVVAPATAVACEARDVNDPTTPGS